MNSNHEVPDTLNDSGFPEEELIFKFLDNELTDQEFAQFEAKLKHPEFQILLAKHSLDHSMLSEVSAEVPVHLPMTQKAEKARKRAVGLADRSSRLVLSLSAIGLATSFVLLVSVISIWFASNSAMIKVNSVVGTVLIDGLPVKDRGKMELEQSFQLVDEESSLDLKFEDGSRVIVTGSTVLHLSQNDQQKQISLTGGNLWADVTPQKPGKPMLVSTPQAEMEILGTELAVMVVEKSTTLEVTEGLVKMTRLQDGKYVHVAADESAMVSQSFPEAFANRKIENDVEWAFNATEGQTEELLLGQHVTTSPNVTAAIRAGLSDKVHDYAVKLFNFTPGLTEVFSDSVLNYTIKMDRPGFYEVILVTREKVFKGQPYCTYEFHQRMSERKFLNEWHTVNVPLKEFKKVDNSTLDKPIFRNRTGAPPELGDVAYLLVLGTQKDDRGLQISRVWFSRGESE